MNKIVCDVCGTSYPDTSAQCPICGTAKTDANKTTAGQGTGYAYVKGGRFSKANVRKRNAGQVDLPRVVAPAKPKKAPGVTPKKQTSQQPQEKQKSNVILLVIAALLVIAIVAVCVFIVREQLADQKPPVGGSAPTNQTTLPSSKRVPCTGLTLDVNSHTFTTPGESFMLSVRKDPIDTTDTLRYESADESIATVDNKGIVTAVADGTVDIYVYCGDQKITCTVICEIGIVNTQPTQPKPTDPSQPTEPEIVLELNSTEFTLRGYGTTHMLYSGELDPSQIQWTSSDETVATVENGLVMAVGNGKAEITAEYMGQKRTCIVRCQDVVQADYELRTRYGLGNDFTLKVGDSIVLYLADKVSGMRIQPEYLNFSVSKDGVIRIDSEGKITALSGGTVTVTVTYGELSFKAIVRVIR